MKMKANKKGFTLVEIIIVVVILAILAALILPRFLSQPERAVIAEGQNTLGAIRRGALAFADTATAGVFPTCALGLAGPCTAAELATMGVVLPAVGQHYQYGCLGQAAVAALPGPPPVPAVPAGIQCRATRLAGPDGATAPVLGSTITLRDTGVYACGGNYTLANAADATRGCA